jgi:hypothetical protein
MPVQTRSNVNAENLQRDEQSAVKGLINLSLIHPDRITPPITPVDKNGRYTPPAPRRRNKRMYVDTSTSNMTEVPPPPILRRQHYSERQTFNTLDNVNTKSILSELKQSTNRLNVLLDKLEQEHYNLMMEGFDYVTYVLD